MLPVGVPYIVSNFAFPSIGFVVTHGFAELPTPDPVLEFHATSSLSPMLQLGLRSFVVIAPSSNVVLMTPQTTRSVVYPLASCFPRGLYFSISNLDPIGFDQASS